MAKAKKGTFMKMSPEVAKGVSAAKNAPARKYGKNPKVGGLGTGKGIPALGKAGARAIPVVGQAVTVGLTAYGVGSLANEALGLSTKLGDYSDRVTGRAKASEASMTTTPRGGAGSGGRPARRGGARKGKAVASPAVATEAKKPAKTASAANTAAPAAKAKATPTMTRGSMKRPEGTVKVADVQNKIEAPAKSGLSKAKRDIKVGGLVGRTGGKWHLGKKVGKG